MKMIMLRRGADSRINRKIGMNDAKKITQNIEM